MSSSIKFKVYFAAILFTATTGFSFFAIKLCVPYGDSFEILAYRYTFAFVPAVIWLLINKLRDQKYPKHPGQSKKYLYLTAIFYFGFMTFQIISMAFATSIEGTLVYAATPIFAKIIGRLFISEKSTWLQNFFMGVTFVALVILILLNATDIDMSLPGIILMAIASILSATSNVFMRYVRGTFKPMEISMTIAIGGFVIFTVANLVHHLVKYGTVTSYFEPLTHLQFLIAIAFSGSVCILLTAQLMSYMLAHLEIVQGTIFGNVATMISVIAGAVLLREPLYGYHILCGILIIAGVLGLSIAPAKKENSGRMI